MPELFAVLSSYLRDIGWNVVHVGDELAVYRYHKESVGFTIAFRYLRPPREAYYPITLRSTLLDGTVLTSYLDMGDPELVTMLRQITAWGGFEGFY